MKQVFVIATLVFLFVLSGCGGSSVFSRDSDIVMKLMRTDGTQVMTQYEIFVTKSNDTSLNQGNSEDYMSSTNEPSWADAYSASRSATQLQVNWRTRSDQVSYFVFVKVPNTGSQFETLKLQIDVDGDEGPERTFDLNINTTQRLTGVRIDRNSAQY